MRLAAERRDHHRLDSGDKASFARGATSAFDECVILADNRRDFLPSLLRAWSHAPSNLNLIPVMAMLESAGEMARQAIREHDASIRLVSRIDAHCRTWPDVRSTPRSMDHARSLFQEARERRLIAAVACIEDICRRQEVMIRRMVMDDSPVVRLSVR